MRASPAAAARPTPSPAAATPTPAPMLSNLSWVDEFVARIRPHVTVREADSLLILMPNQVHRLNRTGLALLKATLAGMPIESFLMRVGVTAERRRETADFFFALHMAMKGCLGEGRGLAGVEIVPFEGSFHRLPVLSEVALTARCNLKCAFCYAACEPGRTGDDSALSTGEVKRILEIIRRDAEVPSTSFTGGEPTLRGDLPDLITHAATIGLRVNLITNGTTATPERALRWVEAGLRSAQVSLEGGSAEVHDALTRAPGSFERTLAGIRALRATGIHVHTNTTINARNKDHLGDLLDRVQSLGLTKLSMNLVLPCGTGRKNLAALTVRYEQIGPIVERVRARAKRLGLELLWYSPVPVGLFNSAALGLGAKGCAACDGLLSVSPSGDVLPCSSYPESVGNLLSQPFQSIWQGREAVRLRAKESAPPACRGCSSFRLCEGACPLYWAAMGTSEATKCRTVHDAAS